MAMELESHPFAGSDWASDAFAALNQNDLHSDKWPTFGNPSFSNPPLTIPPSLLTHGSVERYGQVTPPEELSPPAAAAELPRHTRDMSIPIEELKNEALFPDHQVQALLGFQPQQQQQRKRQAPSPAPSSSTKQQEQQPSDESRPTKRRRASKPSGASQPLPTNQTSTDSSASQATPENPQPPKRKRGRPKSTPQMVEAFTADGFPFQVSSARQSHLEKNRVAAHKCRQRKKEYIGSLEHRAREHAAKNKALKENIAMLREELLELKNEVLRHAGCGFWAVDEYLSRCAGDLLGMQAPGLDQATSSRMQQTNFSTSARSPTMHSASHSPAMSTLDPDQIHRSASLDSLSTQSIGGGDSIDSDDFDGFDLLQDLDEDNEVQLV